MGQIQMADEQVVPEVPVAGDVAAPAPEVTATPVDGASTPEVQPEPPKTFSQEEVDAMVGKRLAREQRKWEREQAARAAPQEPAPDGQAQDVVALAEEIANRREAAKAEAQVLETYHEREESAREKYDDFDQVAYNPALKITTAMAHTIRESEVGPEIAYYLGTNPAEAKRIAQLSPLTQAKELGKLETKLTTNPPAKRTSSAPEPIKPVGARGSSAPVFDTTDPRSIAAMDTSTWIEKERERQRKKWASSNR